MLLKVLEVLTDRDDDAVEVILSNRYSFAVDAVVMVTRAKIE
jgi:hypothetical protein